MCHDVKTSWDFYHDFNNIPKPLLYMGVGSPEIIGLVRGYITGVIPLLIGVIAPFLPGRDPLCMCKMYYMHPVSIT